MFFLLYLFGKYVFDSYISMLVFIWLIRFGVKYENKKNLVSWFGVNISLILFGFGFLLIMLYML